MPNDREHKPLRGTETVIGRRMMEDKTYVEDIDRSIYDIKNEDRDAFRLSKGLTAAIVEQISEEKNDPLWMRQFRLRSLERYHQMQAPDWGPALDG